MIKTCSSTAQFKGKKYRNKMKQKTSYEYHFQIYKENTSGDTKIPWLLYSIILNF